MLAELDRVVIEIADTECTVISPIIQSNNALDIRARINDLESEILKHPQLEITPIHHFSDGVYAREITIPAGTLLTGKVHKTEHLNIVSKGRIVVWTDDGMKEVSAPFTMVSRPGTKRVGYTLEETVWTTIHANPSNTVDIEQLESLLIEPCSHLEHEELKCLS